MNNDPSFNPPSDPVIVHERRETTGPVPRAFHRLIVDGVRGKWVNGADFAVCRGFAASPRYLLFTQLPEVFKFYSVYSTIIKPSAVLPTDDDELPEDSFE